MHMSSASALPQIPDAPHDARPLIRWGVLLIIIVFGGFGTWSAIAPLNSAVLAPGLIAVDTHRKVLQHLEGGIIKEILVREGDKVQGGQAIIRLDEVRPKAQLEILQNEYLQLRAQEARLVAESGNQDVVAYPEELASKSGDSRVAQMIQVANDEFQSRRQAVKGQIAILLNRNDQYRKVIVGLEKQISALSRQEQLIQEELVGLNHLLSKGLTEKSRVLSIERSAADLGGQVGRFTEEIARTQIAIAESELRVQDIQNTYRNEAVTQLKDIKAKLNELTERIRAAQDVVNHLEVRAPEAGTIVNLKVHTIGGVLAPGAAVAEMVPVQDEMIIEAQVRPEDIDDVHAGMAAEIHLTAFKQRITPTVTGRVEVVSADRLVEERTGLPYYSVRISIGRDSLSTLPPNAQRLYPGMPVELTIPTGERTALDYFLQPLHQAFRHSFHEP